MLGPSLKNELPRLHRANGLTVYSALEIDAEQLHGMLSQKIKERSDRWVIQLDECLLFCKNKRIGGMGKRLRLFYKEHIRRYRPFMEIQNNLAIRRYADARLQAIAIYHEFGIIRSISIITDYLGSHITATDYLAKYPAQAVKLTKAIFKTIHELRSLEITHLDLWPGNIMIREKDFKLCTIDHEYTLTGPCINIEQIVGFQLGFLYFHSLHKWLEEPAYQDIIEQAFGDTINHPEFRGIYNLCRTSEDFSALRLALIEDSFRRDS